MDTKFIQATWDGKVDENCVPGSTMEMGLTAVQEHMLHRFIIAIMRDRARFGHVMTQLCITHSPAIGTVYVAITEHLGVPSLAAQVLTEQYRHVSISKRGKLTLLNGVSKTGKRLKNYPTGWYNAVFRQTR